MSLSLGSGTAGATLFVLTFLIDGATRAGYDPVRHTVSALATGPRGWLQTINFVVSGLLITAAGPGLYEAVPGPWFAAVIAVFGLALVASGVFPMDPMRGYPPGTPEGTPPTTSRRHQLHDAAGAVVFTSLPVGAVVAALTLGDVVWSAYSAVTAVVFGVAAGRFATAWEADDPRTGLFQRVAIVSGWTWLALLCWSLIP
ncbi:DUF998 domain-containing protein [Nitriliruptor alkaliphilus]|uniref:DUF998 domain-containing protein n=1 Tax=Nitriliruptor alkaliphilus TaxID=427918 RepID=UPI0006979797|nr:DUF998 domain-containing protein [Nitriliruptor alkaliphilus]